MADLLRYAAGQLEQEDSGFGALGSEVALDLGREYMKQGTKAREFAKLLLEAY